MSLKRTHEKTQRPSSTTRPGRGGVYRLGQRRTGAGPEGLSKLQKARIAQVAREAFDFQDRLGNINAIPGLTESKQFEAWRRGEQLAAVRIASLTECQNEHFRPLLAHFLTLAGRDDEAFRYQMKTGRVKDHGPVEDTHENRELWRAKISQALIEHAGKLIEGAPTYNARIAAAVAENGGQIRTGYVLAIAQRRCKGRSIASIQAEELRWVYLTLVNRIAAKEGRGKTKARNKKQTATAQAKALAKKAARAAGLDEPAITPRDHE